MRQEHKSGKVRGQRRAAQAAPNTPAQAHSAKNGAPAAFTEGFQLVCSQFRAALEKAGVQAIDAEGAAFDPHLHEAITHLPSDDVPEGHVIVQTRRGYQLGDKLLRAAQVVVSSGPGE